jgi:hypothetical protein
VVRNATLSDDQVRALSEAQASRRSGRTAQGALVAIADELRRIAHEESPGQVVYIYDDPIRPDELQHAVIRGKETIPRTDQDDIRDKITAAFKVRIAQN